jgi:hypothetical protein
VLDPDASVEGEDNPGSDVNVLVSDGKVPSDDEEVTDGTADVSLAVGKEELTEG